MPDPASPALSRPVLPPRAEPPFAPLRCPPPGATIAVVAPAGPASARHVAAVPALIQAQGWQARVYPGCHATTAQGMAYLAGPDALRCADLQAALDDPSIAAVWCLRGGYGSARLLPTLRLHTLATQPKLLIGYSDITALHTALDGAGLLALHAPMPASDLLLPGHEADAQALFDLLHQGLLAGSTWAPTLLPGTWHVPGRASGRLVGGNLSALASLVGTPWQPTLAGRVLFLEDIGEPPYRVDRMLLQLRLVGLLDGLAGVLLGSFTQADDATEVLAAYFGHLGVPVLAGWPSGHGTPNQPLPLGALATLDTAAGTLRFEQDVLLP